MGNTKDKNNKRKLQRLDEYAVTMERFLSRFLGVPNGAITCDSLTHEDIKRLFPNLRRASIAQILDDPCLVSSGRVIYVTDANHNNLPYIQSSLPKLDTETNNILGEVCLSKDEISDIMDVEAWSNPETWDRTKQKTTPELIYEELDNMSIHELEILAKIYHASGQVSNRTKVIEELVSREDSKQGVKRSKEKALRKELKRHKNDNDY